MSVLSVGHLPISPIPIPELRAQPVKVEFKQTANSAQILQDQQKRLEQQIQISDLKRIGQALNKKLQFEIDYRSNEVIVKVIDKETDKVIKVIPPEELQRLHRNIKEASGILFNEMV